MRLVKDFNQGWLFAPQEFDLDAPDSRFEPVTLPHTNKLFPTRFVDNSEYQFISTYRKKFSMPDDVSGKRILIDFDGAMLQSTVYCNGQRLDLHKGGFTPFSCDITEHLFSGENVLTVVVDSTEREDIPPYGGRVDYLTFGGIYRDVYLRIIDPLHIMNAFARPINVLDAPALECDVQLSGLEAEMSIEAVLQNERGAVVARQTQPVESDSLTLSFPNLDPIDLWTLESPTLYSLVLTLSQNGQSRDEETLRFGFRSAEFSEDGHFYLNGEALHLFGVNRHQTYPYIGAAAPARLQQQDADIIKYELGCNVVRTSHYPQSPHFLNRCDEIGLLVLEEIPGWQHIGDDAWQAIVMRDVRAMIERDRNHPSIILWGVRINESPDDDELYTETNKLAHELDPTRQTGGVRNFISSHKLEDVFTFNDFSEGIQPPIHKPHLVTEFCGHMFPTKTWDQEERKIEHALMHARKHNLQIGHPDVAGGIAWCAFDYHTHREFGSGDRICHHGVMDMFRLPKMAASFYRSQKSPNEEIVLHAATHWTMGDRSGGGNNPLIIFSNCETIEVFVDDLTLGTFQPDQENFPHLLHPPFMVKWSEPYNPWGTEFCDLTVKGYINDEVVATQQIASDHLPHELCLSTSTNSLKADGIDMVRVAVQILDKYGNILPFQILNVNFTLEGEAEFIGENPLVLMGGQAACYIKSRKSTGLVTLHARAGSLPPASITLDIAD